MQSPPRRSKGVAAVAAVAAAAIILVTAGCGDRRELVTLPLVPIVPSPAPVPSPSPALVPYVDPGFPRAARKAMVYGRISVSHFSGAQRYVLHADGTFQHQYLGPDRRLFEYGGTYSIAAATVIFVYDVESRVGEMRATGTVNGDFLDVRYNDNMLAWDFDDGVFLRI